MNFGEKALYLKEQRIATLFRMILYLFPLEEREGSIVVALIKIPELVIQYSY